MHVWALGLSCEAPAARAPNVHISKPKRFKHHKNSTRRPPRESRKNKTCGGEGKKNAKIWAPHLFQAHPDGPPHPGRHNVVTSLVASVNPMSAEMDEKIVQRFTHPLHAGMVKYTFIQMRKKKKLIQKHFHPKTISSAKNGFIH